jgi:hypothetical protein
LKLNSEKALFWTGLVLVHVIDWWLGYPLEPDTTISKYKGSMAAISYILAYAIIRIVWIFCSTDRK